MKVKVKPIQATPVLSGDDAKAVIIQVRKAPSKEQIAKNARMLSLRKSIVKK